MAERWPIHCATASAIGAFFAKVFGRCYPNEVSFSETPFTTKGLAKFPTPPGRGLNLSSKQATICKLVLNGAFLSLRGDDHHGEAGLTAGVHRDDRNLEGYHRRPSKKDEARMK